MRHRARQLRLLTRQMSSTSPRGLLGGKCDLALLSNGIIASTSLLGPKSRIRAHLTGNGFEDGMVGG